MSVHKKTAVTMTYYNRSELFSRTLKTIKQSSHDDYRVVVVDDGSTEDPLVLDDSLVDVITVDPETKTWKMTVAFNMAVVYALREYDPDIIIVQNAECYHVGDVLMYANDHVANGQCVSFACWNDEGRDPNVMKAIADDMDHTYGCGWYNHPINPRCFNFCNAYSKHDMVLLNGMDERLKDGRGYADDDLVRRTHELKLRTLLTDETKPFVVHQYHSREHVIPTGLWNKNQAIYCAMKTNEGKNYTARHLVTEEFDAVEYTGDS